MPSIELAKWLDTALYTSAILASEYYRAGEQIKKKYRFNQAD